MKTVKILDVEIDNISTFELLEKLKDGGVVFTPNIDHVVKLQSDSLFRQAYRFADYRVCDSQLLKWVSKLIKKPIQEKISGSNLFPAFYHHYRHDDTVKIFLLGSSQGVAAAAMDRINEKVGREMVVGAHSPSFQFLNNKKENEAIIRLINHSRATVLAIGVGAPKQEKWLFEYRDRLPHIKVAMAVGATIDFEAGHTNRAPMWIGDLGLEWLYRLMREPKRLWKRYLLEDTVFFWMLLRRQLSESKLFKKKSSKSKSFSHEIDREIVSDSDLIQSDPDCWADSDCLGLHQSQNLLKKKHERSPLHERSR